VQALVVGRRSVPGDLLADRLLSGIEAEMRDVADLYLYPSWASASSDVR
jgi:hypothetical protein